MNIKTLVIKCHICLSQITYYIILNIFANVNPYFYISIHTKKLRVGRKNKQVIPAKLPAEKINKNKRIWTASRLPEQRVLLAKL